MPDMPPPASPPAGVLRRLAAWAYDTLLMAALAMLLTFALVIVRGGEALPPGSLGYQLFLLALATLFYTAFWWRGGQTLGMRAWRLRVERRDGGALRPTQALVRFAAGLVSSVLLGAGLFWQWLDPDRLTLYDRLAGTRVVVLPKRP